MNKSRLEEIISNPGPGNIQFAGRLEKYSQVKDIQLSLVTLYTREDEKTNIKTIRIVRTRIGNYYIQTTEGHAGEDESVHRTKITDQVAAGFKRELIGTISRRKREGYYAGRKEGINVRLNPKGSLKYYPKFPTGNMAMLRIKERMRTCRTIPQLRHHGLM